MRDKRTEREHLIKCAARDLADQVTDSTHQAAPDQAEPHQRQGLARCVTSDDQHAEQPVDLARPSDQ